MLEKYKKLKKRTRGWKRYKALRIAMKMPLNKFKKINLK